MASTKMMLVKDQMGTPFEKLPNLPKPVIHTIDLGIEHMDLNTFKKKKEVVIVEPSITDERLVRFFKADESTQTDDSDILELKRVSGTVESLMEQIDQLRRDVSYTQHVMKRDYENQIQLRASELYSLALERVRELEKRHAEKIGIIRQSYRSQLSNAIAKIAGEYRAYYDEILEGKTGRHDSRIRELKKRVDSLEQKLKDSVEESQELRDEIQGQATLEEQKRQQISAQQQHAAAFDADMEHKLRMDIKGLEEELEEAQTEMAAKEDSVSKYRRLSESLDKQLEEERVRVVQLKRDMENYHRRSVVEMERAQKLAQNQREVLEKELSKKMMLAEKEASRQATEMAEMQRMKDMARFKQEMDERKGLEEELKRQANQRVPTATIPDTELAREVEKLRKLNTWQESEIKKITREFERSNRVWETKLAIMQKNFHALKDESYLRQQFQRQAALLHYATVGYATSSNTASSATQLAKLPVKPFPTRTQARIRREMAPLDAILESSRVSTGMDSAPSPRQVPPAPTPTPTQPFPDDSESSSPSRPRSVHFEERRRETTANETKVQA